MQAPFDDENSKFDVGSGMPQGGPKKKGKNKPKQKAGNKQDQKKARICKGGKIKLPSFLSSECHSLFKGLLVSV